VNSSIRFVWIALRIFCIAERYWAQASLSAKSPTLVALATTHISLENFVIGSVTHQARTSAEMTAPTIQSCAPILDKVRYRFTMPRWPQQGERARAHSSARLAALQESFFGRSLRHRFDYARCGRIHGNSRANGGMVRASACESAPWARDVQLPTIVSKWHGRPSEWKIQNENA
jgi:hypothetical protein